VAAGCDVLLGPYSTGLVRTAGRLAAERGRLLWNHGGSGDDVEAAHPGHLVSVPTPAGGYGRPFLQRLALEAAPAPLLVWQGPGSFGRQVASGAESEARRLGLEVTRAGPGGRLATPDAGGAWDLLSAGAFEADAGMVAAARALARPPRHVCSVAAGVRDFRETPAYADGTYGVAQWFPGSGVEAEVGPGEAAFVRAYEELTGLLPDYPAAQAAAAAALASHCARAAGALTADRLWAAAAALDTTTLFGGFRIDPATGAQASHETVLLRWTDGRPALA
jgi:hypothetical protein